MCALDEGGDVEAGKGAGGKQRRSEGRKRGRKGGMIEEEERKEKGMKGEGSWEKGGEGRRGEEG